MTATEKVLTLAGVAAAIAWAASRTKKGEEVAADAVEEVIRAGGAAVDGVVHVVDQVAQALRPRGIRNNNPGNIDWIADPAKRWRGMLALEPPGSVYGKSYAARFGVFASAADGVRAIGKELMLDWNRGVRTVRGFINNWAPPNENDTGSYVRAVAGELGVGVDQVLRIDTDLPRLVAAIIRHEQGEQPYGLTELEMWARAA